MVKIKKCVHKFLTIVLALLVVLNTSAIGVLAESANPNEATPGPGDYAFDKSTGTITGLTPEYLKRLSDAKKQNIRLEIPEKIDGVEVKAIGDSAFEVFYGNPISKRYDGFNFVGLDFSRTKHLEIIGKDAFYDCKISGSLTFPDSLAVIGENAFRQTNSFNGIIGKLEFPKGLKSLGKSAFNEQAAITGVNLSNCKDLKVIPKYAFANTKITGALIIPENVQTIETSAFSETAINTVYLPKRKESSNLEFIVKNAFFGTPSDMDIICDKSNYDYIKGIFDTRATYAIPVSFYDEDRTLRTTKNCLFKRAYNYSEQADKTWKTDNDYRFPEIAGNEDKSKGWFLSPSNIQAMEENYPVQYADLFACVKPYEDPVISYSDNIDREYDGTPDILSVTATHPLAKPYKQAKVGDVVFYYTWGWRFMAGTEDNIPKGVDKNSYNIGSDVRSSSGAVCYVTVQACRNNGSGSLTVFYKETHEFIVNLHPKQSVVDVDVHSGLYKWDGTQNSFPELKLIDSNVKGTLTWDENQSLEEGYGIYNWTFKPQENIHKKYNYETIHGSTELYCTKEDLETVIENKVNNLENMEIDSTPTKEQSDTILDTYFAYESSTEDIKEKISEEKQEKIYDAISKLPQVETAAEGLQLVNEKDLLKNMTSKDAVAIKDQQTAKCMIKVVANKETPSEQINEAIKLAAGNEAKIGEHFDVKVVKTIENGPTPTTEDLTTVKKPLKLVFDVPGDLRSSNRKFFIIRAHKDTNGTITAEKLEDEDTNPATITVTSDKFSTYAIAYTEEESSGGSSGGSAYVYDISASAGDHGTITPSGTAYAYYGSAKTFNFTPDEGYKVADVVVDGASVGAVSSYTFENITKAHTISVTFEPIADDQNRIINGVKATTIKASSSAKKGAITVKWKKSAGFKVDYFQVFRSTKKNSGYGTKAFYTTKSGTQKSYKNTKTLKKGTRYYYKVRGVRTIDGVKVYTKWSNKAIRIAK